MAEKHCQVERTTLAKTWGGKCLFWGVSRTPTVLGHQSFTTGQV